MMIAYFDLVDTCHSIDKIISEFVSVDNNTQSSFPTLTPRTEK